MLEKDYNFNHDVKLVRRNNLVGEIVLVDGMGRDGKAMIGHVLATMSRLEKPSFDDPFDTIRCLYMLGKISHDAAVTIMRLDADTRLYNNMVSRNVNFRLTDSSGVYQSLATIKYIRRLFLKEGQPVVDRIMKEKPIFQNLTHGGLITADLFFDTFSDRLKIIHMVRDPVGIIYEWDRRGFGNRIGNDPREFQFTYEWGEDVVPIYAHGWEDEYLSSSPIDRIIGMVDWRFRANMAGYDRLNEERKKQVMFVIFEEFVVDPLPYCEKTAVFLETKTTSRTKKVLKRERCPRVLDPEDRKEKRGNIEKKASEKAMGKLNKLIEEYEHRRELVKL